MKNSIHSINFSFIDERESLKNIASALLQKKIIIWDYWDL